MSLSRLAHHCGWMFALATSGLIVVSAGCQQKNQYIEPPPPEVIVRHPVERDVTGYLDVTGMAHPTLSVDIRARVRGFLKERRVEEGTLVQQDQLLMVIDEEPFKVALDQTQAKLAEAETALRKAEQSQARQMIRAELALDDAQLRLTISDERRMAPLVPSGSVTQEAMDRAIATRKKAEAAFASTQANLAQVDADYETNILAAKASVAAAQTDVRAAQIDLGYCRIIAPIAGRIGRIHFDVGNLVGEPQTSLLATIVKYDPVYVFANLSVDEFVKYRKVAGERDGKDAGAVAVELALASETDYRHQGEINYHDPVVDQGSGTVEVRAVFPNPDGSILPGMFARLRIPVEQHPGALLVPEQAIATDQLGQYVLVVDGENKVNYRHVELGQGSDGLRVVAGKLTPQDRVIVEGLLRARPGLKVVPKLEQAPAVLQAADPAADAVSEIARGPAGRSANQ